MQLTGTTPVDQNTPMTRILAVLLLAGTTAPAFALDCKTASDQVSLNQCAGQDFKAADADLNAVYGQVAGRLSDAPDVKSLLTAAQRSWVAFRDAECAFRSSGSEGGSIHPMSGPRLPDHIDPQAGRRPQGLSVLQARGRRLPDGARQLRLRCR